MKKILIIVSILVFMQGCNNDGSSEILPQKPSTVKLVFPYENSLCNEGTYINAKESTVLFEWKQGLHTDNYELRLKNLATGSESSHITSKSEMPIAIFRGIQYEWYVISKSNSISETAKSASWKFYNAGDAIKSYAPFPAEIISPAMAETFITTASTISLKWKGSDVDNDIVGYDVYFGTSNIPGIMKSNIKESIVENVPIVSNTIYYWKIVTKDERGNSSDSGIYQFKIK